MFNPDEFMNTSFDSNEEFETKRSLIDANEYDAVIEEIEARLVGDDNKPILSTRLKLVNTGDDNIDGRNLFHTIWLDMDSQGALQYGKDKNIGLGQLLAAVGLNGKPWNPGMLKGQLIHIKVGQRFNKRTEEMENVVQRITES